MYLLVDLQATALSGEVDLFRKAPGSSQLKTSLSFGNIWRKLHPEVFQRRCVHSICMMLPALSITRKCRWTP